MTQNKIVRLRTALEKSIKEMIELSKKYQNEPEIVSIIEQAVKNLRIKLVHVINLEHKTNAEE